MGAYLSQPNLEKESENGENSRLRYGASAMQGWRLAQEDGHSCLPDFEKDTALFGVYDGHGGPEVALYCSKYLPDVLKSSTHYKEGDLEKAVEESFMKFDETLKEESVVQELKEIAGINNTSDAEEEEVENLQEEASLPLGELLSRYGMPSNKNQRALRKKVNRDDLLSPVVNKKPPTFPTITDNKDEGDGSPIKGEDISSSESDEKELSEIEKEDKSAKLVKNGPEKQENGTDSDEASKSDKKHSKLEDSTELNSDIVCNGNSDTDIKKVEEETTPKTRKKRSPSREVNNKDEDEEEDDDEYEDDEDEDDEEDEEEDDIDDSPMPHQTNEEPGSDSGTTACLTLLRANEIIVGNIGDSRCVLSRNGNAFDLSLDHKPEDDIELKRIEAAGGKVTLDGRVNGGLNLSRAFGDHCYKTNDSLPPEEQMISAFPDLKRVTLEVTDEFLVIACDGIWNAMTSQEVIDFIQERFTSEPNVKLSTICEDLFDLCLAPDTSGDGTGCDNMTCVIVVFKHGKNKPSGKRKNTDEGDDDPVACTDSKRLKM